MQRGERRHTGGVSGRGPLVFLLAIALPIGGACERSSTETGGGTPLEPTATPAAVVVEADVPVAAPTPTPTLAPTALPPAVPVETKAPVAPPPPNPSPNPTATTMPPTQTIAPEELPERVTELLAEAIEMATADLVGPGDADRAQLMGGILEGAVSEFLNAIGPRDEPALAALNAALSQLPALDWEEPPWPDALWVADLDGDDELEAVAAFGRYGLETYWFDRYDGVYRGFPLPGADPIDSPPWWRGVPEVAGLDDLNGDGRADLLLSTELRGASATIYYLDAFVWRDGGPENVLEWPVEYWAEPSSWTLQDGAVGREFVMTCPAFGIYDAKLLPHPIQTWVYGWDGQRFALSQTLLPEPIGTRDRFNRAEAAFERGDYAAATPGFLAVTGGSLDGDEDLGVDWVAFAYFRLGQIAALSDDPAANDYLAAAMERGGGGGGGGIGGELRRSAG